MLPVGVTTQRDDARRAEPLGREDGGEAHGAVTDYRDGGACGHAGADRGVMPGRHHVGEGEQRLQHRVGVTGARHLHERRTGERHADRFALAAVDRAVAEVPAADAGDRRAVQAVRARHVAEDEGRDHQVAGCDAGDVGTDVFDDADELVADRSDGMVGLAAVVPEVRPAHAGQHDPHDRIGGVLDPRVGSITDGDVFRSVEQRSSHGEVLSIVIGSCPTLHSWNRETAA